MKVSRFTIILLLLLVLQVNANAAMRRVVLNKSNTIKEQIICNNTNYIIKYNFDLKGDTLVIPDNCCLTFKGGQIKNGSIKGNVTRIKAGKYLLFKKVRLSGVWDNDTVYSEWLDFKSGDSVDNKEEFINLMILANGEVYTHLYMQRGTYYCSVIKESSFIKLPSNVYWHNKATICQLETDLPRYALVLINKSKNVTIEGGAFVGDVKRHVDKGGEWGHGIKVAGSSNVTLKNLSCNEFWGDGIDLIEGTYRIDIKAGEIVCSDIIIDNVKCFRNRRTGLSIEAARNVVVRNSEFAYTGFLKMTAPGDGLGIEPWCKNEQKIYNITIDKCDIHDNKGGRDLSIQPNIQYYFEDDNPQHHPKSRINVSNSKVGNLYILFSNELRITDCVVEDIVRYGCSDDVLISNSLVKKHTDKRNIKGLTLINNR